MVDAGQSPRVNVLVNHSDYNDFRMSYDAHSRNSGESLGNLTNWLHILPSKSSD
jgi:hypothetical protein